MRLRLTKKADADIAAILRTTRKLFGKNQVLAYAGIIDKAMTLILQAPEHPRCRPHDDLVAGVKSLHLDHAQGRRGSAYHLIFFLKKTASNGENEILVVAVLHERMIPRRHLARAIRDIQ
ncbi:type II toxin-antitoxin system RelE/ParE family toxin [uncultured Devosia sp.]|uniref:type II toxin-antitoxin system RelE/ParE family toxin n=1 Tax=uncultured Devosia sp. TaxID=211434 RepID=UPI0035C9B8AE